MQFKHRSLIKRFARDQKGSVAIMAAVSISLLLFAAGGAVDYSRTFTAQTTKMQSASDAAALAASATDLTDGERKQIGPGSL